MLGREVNSKTDFKTLQIKLSQVNVGLKSAELGDRRDERELWLHLTIIF